MPGSFDRAEVVDQSNEAGTADTRNSMKAYPVPDVRSVIGLHSYDPFHESGSYTNGSGLVQGTGEKDGLRACAMMRAFFATVDKRASSAMS
jgi:hypothetical protein